MPAVQKAAHGSCPFEFSAALPLFRAGLMHLCPQAKPEIFTEKLLQGGIGVHFQLLQIRGADTQAVRRHGLDSRLKGRRIVQTQTKQAGQFVFRGFKDKLYGTDVTHIAVQGPEAGEQFVQLIRTQNATCVQMRHMIKKKHSDPGLDIAFGQSGRAAADIRERGQNAWK